MTQINIKRVYETPSSNDGYRVLVDRLWPRGMKREYLKYDYWAKELTPSNDLRKWFHADVEKRWGAFADMNHARKTPHPSITMGISYVRLHCQTMRFLWYITKRFYNVWKI